MIAIVYSLEEIKRLIIDQVNKDLSAEVKPLWDVDRVRFVHKYGDGSGETDIETLGIIDRVEISTL